jgi:hypothetical protein
MWDSAGETHHSRWADFLFTTNHKRGEAFFRQLFSQTYGTGLGIPQPGLCAGNGQNIR